MNTDDLADALADAVPDPPEPDGWAARARLRSGRRRDAGLVAAAGLSVVVVAAAATLWSGVGGIGVPAATATPRTAPASSVTGTPQPGTPTADPCAAIGTAPDTTTWTVVPAGAAAVRICRMVFGAEGTPPADELTESVDVLAQAVNSAPRLSTGGMCTADLGTYYTLIFTYPDGSRVLVSGETSGCHPVGGRRGGPEVLTTFLDLLTAQREAQVESSAHSTPPTPAQPCEQRGSWITPKPTDTIAAWLCYGHPAATKAAMAPIEGWSAIARAMTNGAVTTSSTDFYSSNTSLVALSGRGEQVTLHARDKSLYWSVWDAKSGAQAMEWKATDAQWAPIAAALEQAKSQAPPALCGADPLGGPPLPKAGSIVAMSRCVRTADGVLTEYPVNPKMMGIFSDAFVQGPEGFWHCKALPPDPPVEWLETRDAAGTRSTLVLECTGLYRAVDAGTQVAWTPTAEDRYFLDGLTPR